MALTLLNLPRPEQKTDAGLGTAFSISDIAATQDFFLAHRTLSGQMVTPARALRASFVLACIRILTEDVSALPIIPYRDTPQGPQKDKKHFLYPLLNIAPNPIQTAMEMRERIMMDLILHGSFYVLKNVNARMTEISGLYPLPASGVHRRGNELVWDFVDEATLVTGTFNTDGIWRGTVLSTNNFDGNALILLAREAIGLLLAAQEQGARLFAHGIQSDLTLKTADNLTDDQREQLRKNLSDSYSGSRNAFSPLLLEGGLEANRIGLTAQESQYMEARNFQGQEIARIFRIPAVLLGMVGDKSATYASAEQFFQSYSKYTLNPWTVRIEQTIHRDLLTSDEQGSVYVKHDFSALLKADTAARYGAYKIGIDAGFLNPNEARNAEDLPSVPGLDKYARDVRDAPPPGAPGTPGAPAPPAKKPADDSEDALAGRVALMVFRREQKALAGGKFKTPDLFFTIHSAFVEDLTGADLDAVQDYCTMRLNTLDRFSTAAQTTAISALIGLCKKDKSNG
jgi:HK97 family phage portal protein